MKKYLLIAALALGASQANAGLKCFTDGTCMEVQDDPTTNQTFTMGEVGLSGSPTATAKYYRHGNIVILSIPAWSGTSDSTTFQVTGLPTSIRPSSARLVGAVNITNGGIRGLGSCQVNTDGTITFSAGVLGTVFSALLGKGVDAVDVAYLVN